MGIRMITLISDKYSADSCFPLPLLTICIQALNEGELSSHKLDEIWSSFGAELTEVKDTTEQNRTELEILSHISFYLLSLHKFTALITSNSPLASILKLLSILP